LIEEPIVLINEELKVLESLDRTTDRNETEEVDRICTSKHSHGLSWMHEPMFQTSTVSNFEAFEVKNR